MLKRKCFLENVVLGLVDYLCLPETLLVDRLVGDVERVFVFQSWALLRPQKDLKIVLLIDVCSPVVLVHLVLKLDHVVVLRALSDLDALAGGSVLQISARVNGLRHHQGGIVLYRLLAHE